MLFQKKEVEREITYQGNRIKYKLKYKDVKNINLRIKAGGIVEVSANKRIPVGRIEEFIIEKWSFVMKHKSRLEGATGMRREKFGYNQGEAFELFGDICTLILVESDKASAALYNNVLTLSVKDINNKRKTELAFNKFINNLCEETFGAICLRYFPIFEKYCKEFPVVKIRTMKSKWGSCMPGKNQITLNSRLIETPVETIEYVIFHEFAHFVHCNHSKGFYDFIKIYMPDYKERRRYLKTHSLRDM